MKILAEKEAEKFLGEKGFDIIESHFFVGEKELDKFLKENKSWPLAMKVFGNKILHKKVLGGVKLNLYDYGSCINSFEELMKIPNAEGVIVQKQISGIEILFGVKKTPEFGHVISFGQGGSLVEKIADVSFRVCPLDKKESEAMIKETEVGKLLKKEEIKILSNYLMKLSSLVEEQHLIFELDINPLILSPEKEALVVDARIAFE